MIVSWNLLKEFIDLPASPDEAAERLTLSGTEVEGIERAASSMRGVVAAKIEGLENVEPMTFPFECSTDYLREDVAEEPLPRDEALGNAGSKSDGQIKLPKVVL